MPGLGTSFGRGGATTFQQDLQHADCIVIQGSNMAESDWPTWSGWWYGTCSWSRPPRSGRTHPRSRPGRWLRLGKALSAAGAVGALAGRRSRVVAAAAGAALLAGALCTRFGIFEAGRASAGDPKYTVEQQRPLPHRT